MNNIISERSDVPHAEEMSSPIAVVFREQVNETAMYDALTQREKEKYLSVPDQKKYHWLLGRMAGKQAVLQFFLSRNLGSMRFHDIEIVSGGEVPPTFKILQKPEGNVYDKGTYHLSLSHSQGMAVAQVVDGTLYTGVGVDVERIRSFSDHTLMNFLSEREYRQCTDEYGKCREAKATLSWCLKEAYVKAIGTGLRTHPRTVEVLSIGENGTASLFIHDTAMTQEASWTIVSDGYIMASTRV